MVNQSTVPQNDHAFSHIAVCVTALERSIRFYCDGLGFTAGPISTVNKNVAKAIEIDPDLVLKNVYLRRKDVTLELLEFDLKRGSDTPARPPMTRLGVTHLSFNMTEDLVEVVAPRIRVAGGTVLADSHIKYALPETAETTEDLSTELLFCTDPDGLRIELMRLSPAWWAKIHPPTD